MAQAIHSATGLPAAILQLTDRGYLRPGYLADIVVFDPAAFIDRATFDNPQQYSAGVRWLFLAGQAAIADGKVAEPCYGRPIRHPVSPAGKTPKTSRWWLPAAVLRPSRPPVAGSAFAGQICRALRARRSARKRARRFTSLGFS